MSKPDISSRHGSRASHLHVESVPISTLELFPGNARRGDIAGIVDSIREHGLYKPLVVQRSTRRVLCGNHVLAAARQVGLDSVAVVYADVDDETAKRIVLVDNKLSDDAGYDNDALLALLESLPTLDGTGFTGHEVEELLRTLDDDDPLDLLLEEDDHDDDDRAEPSGLDERCPLCGGPLRKGGI